MGRLFFLALPLGLFVTGATIAQQPAASPKSAETKTMSAEAIQQQNHQTAAEVLKQISGKEKDPASAVYKNIKLFPNMPAGRLLAIMEIGFSKSLGVKCEHCHVPGKWESDEKPPKQITRDMSAMNKVINTDLLKKIDGLKGRDPVVNCTTCHRGQLKPALDLDEPKP